MGSFDLVSSDTPSSLKCEEGTLENAGIGNFPIEAALHDPQPRLFFWRQNVLGKNIRQSGEEPGRRGDVRAVLVG